MSASETQCEELREKCGVLQNQLYTVKLLKASAMNAPGLPRTATNAQAAPARTAGHSSRDDVAARIKTKAKAQAQAKLQDKARAAAAAAVAVAPAPAPKRHEHRDAKRAPAYYAAEDDEVEEYRDVQPRKKRPDQPPARRVAEDDDEVDEYRDVQPRKKRPDQPPARRVADFEREVESERAIPKVGGCVVWCVSR